MADTFRQHARTLTELQIKKVSDIKAASAALEEVLNKVQFEGSPPGGYDNARRCFALARTKLEECVMWATKGAT